MNEGKVFYGYCHGCRKLLFDWPDRQARALRQVLNMKIRDIAELLDISFELAKMTFKRKYGMKHGNEYESFADRDEDDLLRFIRYADTIKEEQEAKREV